MKELVTKIDAFRRELGMKQEELAEPGWESAEKLLVGLKRGCIIRH